MIAKLRGCVDSISGSAIVLDVGGVGYELLATRALVERIAVGESLTVVVYTEVREESIRLFGFADELEKQVFNLLLLVKGVGAKTAMEIISLIDKRELLRAIGDRDSGRLQQVKGVGKKTAERIIVELNDKVSAVTEEILPTRGAAPQSRSSSIRDAIDALEALGFSRADAENAVQAVERSGVFDSSSGKQIEPGVIVREALRFV